MTGLNGLVEHTEANIRAFDLCDQRDVGAYFLAHAFIIITIEEEARLVNTEVRDADLQNVSLSLTLGTHVQEPGFGTRTCRGQEPVVMSADLLPDGGEINGILVVDLPK